MLKQLLIFPFGGNAREACSILQGGTLAQERWEILGFVDDNSRCWGQEMNGIKVLGGREVFQKFADAQVIAVPGNPHNYLKRKDILDSLAIKELRFTQITHPSVSLAADASVGHNVLLMPNVVVGCGVAIGNHCVILPNTTVGHDTVIGNYCCIGSNVSIGGSVTIQTNCYIGSGAMIRDNVTIGEKSLVGLGSNVVKDVEREETVAGNPAKKVEKAVNLQ